jgi:xyloglucan-specific exo-beta-1,4-glucanase
MTGTSLYFNRRRRWILLLLMSLPVMVMTLVPTSAGPSGTAHAAYHQPDLVSQAYTWKNVVTGGGGGFVDDIIFNQKQKDLIYAHTDIGGAYRWNPATGTWTQLLNWVSPDQWNITGVESLATDPVNPNRLYIAGGTYTNSWATTNGVILRSMDYGRTFQQTPMPFKMGGNMPGRGMSERLAIDPNDDAILYFGARSGNGLWRSTDYGVTWSKVTNFPDTGPFAENPNDSTGYESDPIGIVWETFDPSTGRPGHPTQTIYVGVADNRSGADNIYRSTDGGKTWAAIPGEPICSVSGTTVTCTGGATWDTSSNATTGYLPHQGKLDANGTLYVTYSDWEGPYNGNRGDVWKFDPKTSTWTKISPVPGSDAANDIFGYGGLGIDRQHPGTLVVAAVNLWYPDTELFRTTDGGATWKRIWDWNGYPDRTLHYTIDVSNAPWLDFGVKNPTPPSPAVKVGWMIEGLNIDPFNSDRMMYGTGATLYATNNLTAWDTGGQVAIKSTALGIEEEAVLGLVSPPINAHLYSVVGDVSGWRHDDLTKSPAEMYTTPYAGTYQAIDYADLNPNFMVRVGYGNPGANPPVTSTAFSTDGGTTWVAGKTDVVGISAGNETVAAAADGSRVVWAPNNAAVSYSTDNGATWTASANIPQNAAVASDRVNPKKFYGYGNGKFWVSIDGGATFTATAAPGLPIANDPVVVKAVPGHEGDIWIAGGSTGHAYGLWHSTDGGNTFTQLSNVTSADSIGFGMPAPGHRYVALYAFATIGGWRGIFRSDDGGKSWIRINDSQHQYAQPRAITGDPRIYGRVYFGTNGFGIIYGDIAR